MIAPRLALALALALGAAGSAIASAMPVCSRAPALTAAQQDHLLRFAQRVRQELQSAATPAALIARAGLDLRRFAIRYSHAGVSLAASENAPWSVRQLYYACDEQRPRLYDQGLAGFVMGNDDPAVGYVSLVLLPPAAAAALERAALDKPRALRLLAARYSANAYPFSLRYQNCNQWVAELLAAAWGGLDDADDLRARAQAWLAGHGYAPPPVDAGAPWLALAGAFVPWLHLDDHPEDDQRSMQLRISLPAALEAYVRDQVPGAQRIELCHDARRIVVHRGWTPVAEGCRPADGDEVVEFEPASGS